MKEIQRCYGESMVGVEQMWEVLCELKEGLIGEWAKGHKERKEELVRRRRDVEGFKGMVKALDELQVQLNL